MLANNEGRSMNNLKEAVPDKSNVPACLYQRPPIWSRRLSIGRLLIHVSLATDEARVSKPEITVYNRLSALRTERCMSRRQLASELDISYQTVVSLERGEYNPSLELALRVSRFFSLPVEDIFSYIGSHSYREYL